MRVTACLSAFLLLAACAAELRPPSVAVKPIPVKVQVGSNGGGFCPPGQAKKGNC